MLKDGKRHRGTSLGSVIRHLPTALRWKKGINAGHLQLYGPDFEIDCITSEDIGRVSGTILVKGSDGHAVYLYGPQLASHRQVAKTVAKALENPDLVVEGLTAEEGA
jgi:hypothetical protein